MDLHIAAAASMLPGQRARVAAAFQECRLAGGAERSILRQVLARTGFPEPMHADIVDAASRAGEAAVRAAAAAGFTGLAAGESRYPALLACTADPPPVLWAVGQVEVLARPAVAVIGSRAASPYALQVARRLAGELAERGLVVASGLARGVDSAAHRGCLEAGGATVAVLGSGLDRIYPVEHVELAAEIGRQGAVLSELAPGAPPLPDHFPLRNRIISGISLAVVVVEASEKSGSLITARCALEQGRDVMAVPGSVLNGRNRGSHSLLKDGAKVVESADDVLEELGWPDSGRARPAGRPSADDPLLTRMRCGEAYGLDELAGLTATPGARLLPRLMELELKGLVASSAGKFTRL
jgi:DNA processing protein